MQKVSGERYVYRFVYEPDLLFALAFPGEEQNLTDNVTSSTLTSIREAEKPIKNSTDRINDIYRSKERIKYPHQNEPPTVHLMQPNIFSELHSDNDITKSSENQPFPTINSQKNSCLLQSSTLVSNHPEKARSDRKNKRKLDPNDETCRNAFPSRQDGWFQTVEPVFPTQLWPNYDSQETHANQVTQKEPSQQQWLQGWDDHPDTHFIPIQPHSTSSVVNPGKDITVMSDYYYTSRYTDEQRVISTDFNSTNYYFPAQDRNTLLTPSPMNDFESQANIEQVHDNSISWSIS